MSVFLPKILNIFQHGLLAGGGDFPVKTSFDSKGNKIVSLNCISDIDGIETSLSHPAKGGLTVTLEERVGEGGILDEALKRNADLIQVSQEELAMLTPSLMTFMARRSALKQDSKFLEAISQKTHQTALFILNLELHPDDNQSTDGCNEVSRPKVLPEKISEVLGSVLILN